MSAPRTEFQIQMFSESLKPIRRENIKCSVDACKRQGIRRGMCKNHYSSLIYRDRAHVRQGCYDKSRTPKGRMALAKSSAKRAGHEWSISLEDYAVLLSKPCHYCASPTLGMTGRGLDRINNARGYVLDNVLPCCPGCNIMRGDMLTVEEMECAVRAIIEYRISKGIPHIGFNGGYTRGKRRLFE